MGGRAGLYVKSFMGPDGAGSFTDVRRHNLLYLLVSLQAYRRTGFMLTCRDATDIWILLAEVFLAKEDASSYFRENSNRLLFY